MGVHKSARPEFLGQGELARLIPVVADSSKEQRITSALLAVLMSVKEFGGTMLQLIGAPATKTSRISCWTEVIFKQALEKQRFRPDGLIVVSSGARQWSAIVEAKVGSAELGQEQIETYLDVAKENRVNAVITISNQVAALPTHHPVLVSKRKTKNVSLYHWSWASIMSEAILLAEYKGVSDPDQAFLLRELIRYLEHSSSGVLSFTRMGAGWQELCSAVQQGSVLPKNSPYLLSAVRDWHQLTRFISLKMSLVVGRTVSINLSRQHAEDPSKRALDTLEDLLATNQLAVELVIPDAAARLRIRADLKSRTLISSMRLIAPTDRVQARSLVNWALQQVSKCEDDDLVVRAVWPGRSPDTSANLAMLRANPKIILNANSSQKPVGFEFIKVSDLAGRFRGPNTFVESAVALAPEFYSEVGQHLKAWVPSAPKVSLSPMAQKEETSLPDLNTEHAGDGTRN